MNNIKLLLTACINPGGMSFTVLQDSSVRRRQYENALDFYLQSTDCKIVFTENTGTYIGAKYQEYIDAGRIEFITFCGNDYSRELGKGYGEAQIIQKALERSKIINPSDYIVKITGRLIIGNIKQLLREMSCRKKKCVVSLCAVQSTNSVDSYFFIAHREFFTDYFLKKSFEINDSQGIYFEHILYHSIMSWLHSGNHYYAFWHFVQANGISGSTGLRYPQTTILRGTKTFLKAMYVNVLRRGRYIF